MSDAVRIGRQFWDNHAKRDPLWAILSDPSKTGRRWNLSDFLETGRREISLLMYQLRALGIDVDRRAALDFGCGVGRLSQPLAQYFDKVTGVDISPEMIRLAEQINQHPETVRYLYNSHDDLAALATDEFTFMYSNVVLQHIEPAAILNYLRELMRVVGPGGVLVFQLPSHERPPEEQRQVSRPMPDDAYRASIEIEGDLPGNVARGSEIVLVAAVTNLSGHTWFQQDTGPIRFGNHWAGEGGKMLVQDDGRAELPGILGPGETGRLTLTVTAPPEPGDYELQCDLVHEGVSWFGDKGSNIWRGRMQCGGGSEPAATAVELVPMPAPVGLSLDDYLSAPDGGTLPMFGVHSDLVDALVNQEGGSVLHREIDERCGHEWIGYRYFVRKH